MGDPFRRDEDLPPIDLAPLPETIEAEEDWGDGTVALPRIHPANLAGNQIVEASLALDRDPRTFTRWPFPDLDALTGPIAPGNVWFLAATSGGGKTTFVVSCIDRWQKQGRRVYVMPLETRPYEFRTYLACMEAGLHPGDVLSGDLMRHPDYRKIKADLKEIIIAQGSGHYLDHVMVSGQRWITLKGLETGLKEAKAFGADIVIVDHIDQIGVGDGETTYSEAKRITDGALQMAQDNDMQLWFTSQLKQSASVGDYLAKFMPPRKDHVLFGGLKENICTGMIGLFRPLRKRRHDEDPEAYISAIKAARSGVGDVSVTDVLEPNTMGVVAMKLRNYGSREGQKAYLRVERGRCEPIPERDKYTTASGYPRPVL